MATNARRNAICTLFLCLYPGIVLGDSSEDVIVRQTTSIVMREEGRWEFRKEIELTLSHLEESEAARVKDDYRLQPGGYQKQDDSHPYLQSERLVDLGAGKWKYVFSGRSNSPVALGLALEEEIGVRASEFSWSGKRLRFEVERNWRTADRGEGRAEISEKVDVSKVDLVEVINISTRTGTIRSNAPGVVNEGGTLLSLDVQKLYREIGSDGWYLAVEQK